MKSLSLDSPESSELHAQRRRITPPNNNSRMSSPSSPSNKRLLGARGMRTGSVDLPDQEMERSLSSASTSPCPSPKPHRLLPTNLYAVLYNFQARHQDELDLRAGYKVTVIDSSDPDWWKGKCLGRVGFFPSKYCTRLQAGEKVLQVTHNVQTGDRDPLTLLRDQIVVQVGEENKGLVSVRVADRRTGMCPVKYLLEV
ncbi:SH3 and cysteine-rich domain-containing protein 3-like [Ctenocephalides felis]|uniref:SH3 and cysteine-rich domain-containing protein 3-like n=1 Tax=Ctenocephalides felis TaxID=7515 RepID=UPI000E6E5176|nr:SH3 and cysteine-rich domain-containing protein 3-like [Ctenocephalides felis]